MATALYRRYRPESFAEVIGQDHVTEPIRRALKSGRIGHAYLFSGPRGCGKTTSARILARCLNCAEGPTDTPCGTCDSCRDLARDGAGSLDVVEIDAASHGGVDDARDLRERAAFAPVRDRFKVFIIDEAHMVTSAGFNALLKLVEEPPEHVKFVFATTEPDKVIGTIRSRTHHYPFRLIPPQVLLPYLEQICAQEGVAVEDGVLSLAVRAGGGSARDTLSVLDQLIAGSDERGVELEVATNLLGFTDVELLNRAVDAIAAHDAATLFGVLDEVIGSGHEPRRFVEDLLERFRDLIVLVAAPERARELLPDVPSDQVQRLSAQAEDFEPRTLTNLAQVTSEALNSMVGATSPRLHLELLAARLLLSPATGTGEGAIGARPGAVGGAPGASFGGANGGGAAQSDASRQTLSPRQRAVQIAREQAAAAAGRDKDQVSRAPQAEESSPHAHRDPAREEQRAVQADQPRTQPKAQEGPEHVPASPEAEPVKNAQASRPTPEQPQSQPRRPAPSNSDDSWGDLVSQQPSDSPKPNPATEQPAHSATKGANPQATPADSGASASDVEGHWSALMDTLQTLKRASWALIAQNAGIQSFDGSTLVLSFRSQGLVNAFYRGQHAPHMAEAVRRIMRIDVTVEATSGDVPPGDGRGGSPSNGSPANGNRSREGGPPKAAAPTERWGDAVAPAEHPAPSPHVPGQNAANARATRDAEASPGGQPPVAVAASREPDADVPPFFDEEPPGDEDAPSEDYTPQRTSEPEPEPRAQFEEPTPARDTASMPRGVTEPVRIPAQPGEGEPRTHGQKALKEAMASAFGQGFEPAATLVDAPEANVPAGHEKDPAIGRAQAEVDAEQTDAWSGTATATSTDEDSWGLRTQPDVQRDQAPERQELKRGPGLGPAGAPRLTGAALARQALHEAQANRHGSGAHAGYGLNGRSQHSPKAQESHVSAEGHNYDDPFQGASLDDEDASSTGSQRRPGRDIVEEFLGGEVLEVIDEQP